VRDVMVNGVSSGPRTSYYLRQVTTSQPIEVSFEPDVYNITASVVNNGTVSPEGLTSFSRGANQVYTMTPTPGWVLLYLWFDGRNVGAPTTYTFSNR